MKHTEVHGLRTEGTTNEVHGTLAAMEEKGEAPDPVVADVSHSGGGGVMNKRESFSLALELCFLELEATGQGVTRSTIMNVVLLL